MTRPYHPAAGHVAPCQSSDYPGGVQFLLEQARAVLPVVTDLRRSIHREPEIGLNLPLTQAKVLEALEGLPLEIRRGQRTTSIVADLRGRKPGPTLILRGDMDALPLQEDTSEPFQSTVDGRMHACGHDAHTAMLTGAASVLAQHQAELAGVVRFMFQPGEEDPNAGALIMLEEGLLEPPAGGSPPAAAFALHASPASPPGDVLTGSGAILASTDNFTVVVRGRGGHAAYPHLAADPVPVACEVAMALQTMVTRSINVFSPGVLTVGRIEAGTASNIIPETATLHGIIRTLSPETRATLVGGLARVSRGVAAAHGLEAEVHNQPGYPVAVNDDRFAELVLEVGRELLGSEHSLHPSTPELATEDFAYVLERIPGAMSSLGSRPAGFDHLDAPHNHSNRYLFNEAALPFGIAMHAAVALKFLSS